MSADAKNAIRFDNLEQVTLPDTPQLQNSRLADLLATRAKSPFMPIVPLALPAVLVNPAQSASVNINIPDNAVLMKVSGLAPFFMTRNGNANGLTSAQLQLANEPASAADHLVASETDWLFVGNAKQISVLSPSADNFIGAKFIMRDQL